MSPEMSRVAEDYLARLRRSMRGVSRDVVEEVEQEIRAHIEDAAAARHASTVGEILDILDRLGPPEEYARDLGLYGMVDRGYREWSVPHMIRSTAFWALSTVAGAIVVGVFGLLYLGAVVLLGAGVQHVANDMLLARLGWPIPRLLSGVPTAALVGGGLVGLAGLTVVVRWFIGQYVRSARPHTLGGEAGDHGWVERTSGRIVRSAVVGLVLTVVAGLAAGVYRIGAPFGLDLPADYLGSPLAVLSGLGMLVFLLAPVLGLLWTAAVERGDDGRAAEVPARGPQRG